MTEGCYPRNTQICNKIDTLDDNFEIASAAALFYPEKGISKPSAMKKERMMGFWGLSPLTAIHLSFFIAEGTSTLAMTGGYTPYQLVPLWLPEVPHPVDSAPFLASPCFVFPKDAALASPLVIAKVS